MELDLLKCKGYRDLSNSNPDASLLIYIDSEDVEDRGKVYLEPKSCCLEVLAEYNGEMVSYSDLAGILYEELSDSFNGNDKLVREEVNKRLAKIVFKKYIVIVC